MISSAVLGGIVFNEYDEDGTFWGMDTLEGWGSPGTDAAYQKKVGQHGAWSLVDKPTLTERSISIGGVVKARTYDLLVAAQHKLEAAVTPGLSPFSVIQMNGEKLTVQAQRDGEVIALPDNLNLPWSAQLKAPDPRKYGDSISRTTGLPSTSGGLTWPVTWPISWSGITVSGVITIDNPGNTSSPIFLRIDGPCLGPYIRHVNSGIELELATDYNLVAGSWLDIDMQRRQVLEGGTASRNAYITRRGFFQLDPGVNQIIFGAASYNAEALLTLTTTPTYL